MEAHSQHVNNSATNNGIEWFLKPLTILLKLLTGVQLPIGSKKNRTILRVVFFAYGVMTIMANIGVQVITYIYDMAQSKNLTNATINNKETLKTDGNDRQLIAMSSSIQLVIVHLSFLIVPFTESWRKLWSILRELQADFMTCDFDFRTKHLRVVLLGMFVPLIDCINALWGIYFSISADGGAFFFNKVYIAAYAVMTCFSTLPSMTVCVLVQVLVVLAGSFFDILSHRICELKESSAKSQDSDAEILIGLNDWKRKHLRVTQMVERLNECFGLVTLLVIMRGLISIMVSSYNVMIFNSSKNTDSGEGVKIYAYVSIALETFYISLPIGSACYLHAKIVKMQRNLFRLNSSLHQNVQKMLRTAVIQAYKKVPVISAAGFFEVNVFLIPTLVGTTVTYIMLILERANKVTEIESIKSEVSNCQ